MPILKRAAACLGLVLASVGALQAAEFIHTPVLSGPLGEDLDIQASLLGADNAGNLQVRLFYRPRGVEIYRSVVMGGPNSGLDAVIPGNQVTEVGVEYYIEADSYSGGARTVLATYPISNPELNPVEVVVRRDTQAPQVSPLSPADGDSVDTSTPVISASFDDPMGALNLASVVVKIDAKAVDPGGLQVYETVVTYLPPAPLLDGTHTVSITVTNKAGHTGTASWSFRVGASASESLGSSRRPWLYDGALTLESMYGAVLKQPALQTTGLPFQPYGVNNATLAVNARGPEDTFSLKVFETDQERTDQQPVDRYTATWTNREGSISLGDVSPSFSELSMYDLYELRGLDLNLLSGDPSSVHTRFEGVWGQTERAINAGAGDLSNTLTSPTYSQYLYGARWEAGDRWFQWGLNSVTINDDSSSLNNPLGVQPQYNTVESSDVRISLPYWLTLNSEAAVDYFAADQTAVGVSVGSAYTAGLLWDAKPLGSRLTFEWRDLGGGFGFLPGGYSTMANPGLQSDYRGFESAFTQNLFQGRLVLNLAENNWRDNLDLTKPTTTTTNYLDTIVAIAPEAYLPSLTLGYAQSNVYNNGSVTLVDSSGNTPSQFINQLTGVYNAALAYNRAVGGGTGSLNLSYVGTDLTDLAPYRSIQNIESWNLVLAAFYGRGPTGFTGTLGLGGSTDPSGSDPLDSLYLPTQNSSSLSAGLHWNQQWGAGPLSSNLGWDIVQTDAATQAGAQGALGNLGVQVNDNTRDTFSAGTSYRINPSQKLALNLSYALVNAWLNTGVGSGTAFDSLDEMLADMRYDLTF